MLTALWAQTWAKAIKARAQELGFIECGIASVEPFTAEEIQRFRQWLQNQGHATMHYMEETFDLRVDVRQIFPDARSVICVLDNYYYSRTARLHPQGPKIARYAHGIDYHRVVTIRLKKLLQWMKQEMGEWVEGWHAVDSKPVWDRMWAWRAGLGWRAKSTMLIHPKWGTYHVIGLLFVNVPLAPDAPLMRDYCGRCHRCIDACPTGALRPYYLDARKCISYLTIEYRGDDLSDHLQWTDWLFGCDICQEVCPWNRFARPTQISDYQPLPVLQQMDWNAWLNLRRGAFRRYFRYSPLRRAGLKGVRRTLRHLLKHQNTYSYATAQTS